MSKKIISFLTLAVIAIVSLFVASACSVGDVQKIIDDNKPTVTKLSYPTNIFIDDDSIIRWDTVENSGSYNIIIDNVSYSSQTPSFDVKKINIENGKHEVYLKAIASTSSYSDSELSPVFKFEYTGNVISEDGDKSTGMFGLFDDLYTREAYIGYGYNVIDSSYVNSEQVKTNYRIFDYNKLKNKDLVMLKDHSSEDLYISGDSVSSYQAAVEAKLKSKISYGNAFSGSINAKFKTTSSSTSSALFYEYSHTTKAYQLILQCDFEEYKEMLTEAFKRDLLNLKIDTLFNRYGTHVITSVIMGGRFDLSYTMLSDEVIDTASLSASLDTSFKAWGLNTSLNVSVDIENKAAENNTTINVESACYGGDHIQMNNEKAILSNYQQWLSTIDENPSLVGIRDINSLIPIWELLGDSAEERARKEELAAAFEKYGEETYNALLNNYDINEPIAPESLEVTLVDKNNNDIDVSDISAGSTVYLKLSVYPEIATYYTRISFDKDKEDYIKFNSKDNAITLSADIPNETKINLTVNIGHGLSKTIALWVYKNYKVTFNSNGGSEVAAIDKIRQGARVDEPASPVKEGYIFKHWYYVDEANTQFEYDFNSSVVGNITLFASWEKYYPTITVIHNIEERQNDVYKCEYNKAYNLPQDLTENGYTFKGYYSDREMLIAYDESTAYKADATVYAKWEKNTYTVTFNSNGGTQIESQKVKYKELAKKPENPTKLGATFGGWCKDVDCLQSFDFNNDLIIKDITLYAYFTVNGIEIEFNTDGGNEIEKVGIEAGNSLGEKLRTPEKAGYTFNGWYDKNGNRVYANTVLTENTTLKAKWEANTYIIIFNSNNNEEETISQTFNYNEYSNLHENEFKRDGYTFIGWANDKNATEIVYTDKHNVRNVVESGEYVLYAVWEANRYTITYNVTVKGDYTFDGENETVVTDQNYILTVPYSDYFKFDGWFTTADGGIRMTDESGYSVAPYSLAKNLTLYAHWGEKRYDAIYISTAEELAAIDDTEDSRNASYMLVNDIDMGGIDWAPLAPFAGTFDGQYHAIYNFIITSGYEQSDRLYDYGLFGILSENGTIKNLQVGKQNYVTKIQVGTAIKEGITFEKNCNAGMIVGNCSKASTVENCKSVFCNITTYVHAQSGSFHGQEVYNNVGGICGVSRGYISQCAAYDCTLHSYASSSYEHIRSMARAGGIIGYSEANEVTDCLAKSNDIFAFARAVEGSDGGWFNLNFAGNPDSRAGGIVGTAKSVKIERCVVLVNNTILADHKWCNEVDSGGKKHWGTIAGSTDSTSPSNLVGVNTTLQASGTKSDYPITVIKENSFATLITKISAYNNGKWYSDKGEIGLKFKP